MAIQPIDLQTLFSQVDKVGKSQIALREGLAIQQDIEGLQIQKKAEERVQEVNKAQDQGDGVDKINDRREQKHGQANKGKTNPDTDEEEAPAEAKSAVIRDPSLGKNIDISL